MEIQTLVKKIDQQIQALSLTSFEYGTNENTQTGFERIKKVVEDNCASIQEISTKKRVEADYLGFGPLENLLLDAEVTEILIQNHRQIFFEKEGKLFPWPDSFLTVANYENALKRIFDESQIQVTLDYPLVDGNWRGFRLTVTGSAVTRGAPFISLRRHPENPWTLEKLRSVGWCTNEQADILRSLIKDRKNLFVIGSTGAGKTSVLNALMHELPIAERIVTIEDSSELTLPNDFSSKLITRIDPTENLKPVNQAHLIRQALRIRPDRIIVGEVRGEEAKDFLMAISTGHSGSWGTIHACDPHQALIRLEMLIQLGAPQWSLESIRRLIQLSLDYIVICKKENGKRQLDGIYRIGSLESSGFLIDRILC
ncbi:MAG: CpaF family protein [Pseudobdellovibrionaceae bacterium]